MLIACSFASTAKIRNQSTEKLHNSHKKRAHILQIVCESEHMFHCILWLHSTAHTLLFLQHMRSECCCAKKRAPADQQMLGGSWVHAVCSHACSYSANKRIHATMCASTRRQHAETNTQTLTQNNFHRTSSSSSSSLLPRSSCSCLVRTAAARHT